MTTTADAAWLAELSGRPLRVATVGDNCIDMYPATGASVAAGNAVNVAIDLVALGVEATFVGRIGDDEHGRRIVETLAAHGVGSAAIVGDTPTCLAYLEVAPDGTTVVAGIAGDCSYPTLDDGLLDELAGHGIVYMKGVADAGAAIAGLRARGAITIYDYSTFFEELSDTAADLSLFSAEALTRKDGLDLLARARDRGARLAVATRGPYGALASYGAERYDVAAEQVDVIDTIGAGDAFAAALLAALMRGRPVAAALDEAAREGSATCTFVGAWRRPADEGVAR